MYQFKSPLRLFLSGPSMFGQPTLLTRIIQNRDKMFIENQKNVYYCHSALKESYDKIKTITPVIKFIRVLDMFNESPNTWFIIDDLTESI